VSARKLRRQDRQRLLRRLADDIAEQHEIDAVLDDMRIGAATRQQLLTGKSESTWREVFHHFETGGLEHLPDPKWVGPLLEVVLDRCPSNPTFREIAAEYAPDLIRETGQADRHVRNLSGQLLAPAAEPADLGLQAIMDRDHFLSRLVLRLGPAGADALVFSGRGKELRQLREWALGEGPALLVITGKPGAGKSALLGTVVHGAHPLVSARYDVPVPRRLAVVHARGRSVGDITRALASQWDVAGGRTDSLSPGALAHAVRHLPERPSLVLDALDRARHPQDLITALVLPLVQDCRLLVATRPGESLDALADRVQRLGLARETGYLDLDLVTPDDLEDYVLLTMKRASPDLPASVQSRLRKEIARALTAGDVQALGYGHFMVARLWLAELLRERELLLVTAPGRVPALISGLPRNAPGIVDLDIGHAQGAGRDWARPVIATLAFTMGDGMPEAMIRRGAYQWLREVHQLRAGYAGSAPGEPTAGQIVETILALDPYLHYAVDDKDALLYRLGHPELIAAAQRDLLLLGLDRDRTSRD